MTPFYGQFLDKNGVEHALLDYLDTPKQKGLYDQIIRTQEAFDALISSPDWLGAKSVAFVGDGGNLKFTKSGLGIVIPLTVFKLHGFNNATIEHLSMQTDAPNFPGAIGYEQSTMPKDNRYSINNISLICNLVAVRSSGGFMYCPNLTNCTVVMTSSVGNVNGFHSCINLTNCVSTCTRSGQGYGRGYYSCTNLINCIATGQSSSGVGFDICTTLNNCTATGIGTFEAYGFTACTNLTNCVGTGTMNGVASNSVGRAFRDCTRLINCVGKSTAINAAYALGFLNCIQMTNCTGSGVKTGTGAGTGTAFSSGSYINGCKEGEPISTTGIWSGVIYFRDEQSNQLTRST